MAHGRIPGPIGLRREEDDHGLVSTAGPLGLAPSLSGRQLRQPFFSTAGAMRQQRPLFLRSSTLGNQPTLIDSTRASSDGRGWYAICTSTDTIHHS